MLALISDTGIIVLVAAIALLFGASHIPKLARNIGEAGKEFRKAHAEMDGTATPASPPTPAVAVTPSTPTTPSAVAPDAPAALQPATDRITLSRAELDALLATRGGSDTPVSAGPGLASS
jgi:TatA/E family protein of Tat protein translocase